MFHAKNGWNMWHVPKVNLSFNPQKCQPMLCISKNCPFRCLANILHLLKFYFLTFFCFFLFLDPVEFLSKNGKVQKFAVQKALSNAFKKILLVIFGKTGSFYYFFLCKSSRHHCIDRWSFFMKGKFTQKSKTTVMDGQYWSSSS